MLSIDVNDKGASLWIASLNMEDFESLKSLGLLEKIEYANTDEIRYGKGMLFLRTETGNLTFKLMTCDIETSQLDLPWREVIK